MSCPDSRYEYSDLQGEDTFEEYTCDECGRTLEQQATDSGRTKEACLQAAEISEQGSYFCGECSANIYSR